MGSSRQRQRQRLRERGAIITRSRCAKRKEAAHLNVVYNQKRKFELAYLILPSVLKICMIFSTANYWRATQTNQNYRYATHTNINYSYATLLIKPFTATSLMLVMLALTLYNRFNTIILTKSYLFL
jgi:hypothetical protein